MERLKKKAIATWIYHAPAARSPPSKALPPLPPPGASRGPVRSPASPSDSQSDLVSRATRLTRSGGGSLFFFPSPTFPPNIRGNGMERVLRSLHASGLNTNLSCRRCRGPARRWRPWRSPDWRSPWWPLSPWACSSERPGLLASWRAWSPCSGPGPGSVRRTNNRLGFVLEKRPDAGARTKWNMKTKGAQLESMKLTTHH